VRVTLAFNAVPVFRRTPGASKFDGFRAAADTARGRLGATATGWQRFEAAVLDSDVKIEAKSGGKCLRTRNVF
jgi:hypothetical protein